MAKRRYGVFVSSTYEDLKDERQRLRELLIHHGHFPLGMEGFDGGARRSWSKITEEIDECDYFVLMVAGRYGSPEPSDATGLSFTEREYDWARKKRKEILVLILTDPGIAQLPPEKVESARRAKDRLKAFQNRLRRDSFLKFVHNAEQFKDMIHEVPKWINARPQDQGGWIRADELTEMKMRWERERSYRDVLTYLFDRLNPYDNLFTREILAHLNDEPLTTMSEVTHVLTELIDCYVYRIIDARIRVYFAYSLTRAHFAPESAFDEHVDPGLAIYRFGISNSRQGRWMEGTEVSGPSNLHNVYRKREILGIRDSKQFSGEPDTMNQPITDEGSVIAAPVLYGQKRYSVGVVGLNSPRRDEALKYRPFVRELSILFSSLFYAYGEARRLRESIAEEGMACKIRTELVEYLGGHIGGSPRLRPSGNGDRSSILEVTQEDLVNEVPAVQRIAFRDSLNTHMLDRVPSAVPVDWLATLFYFDACAADQRRFVKVQVIAFSRTASGRTEVRGRAVNSLGGLPAPNKRAYLIRAATGDTRAESENVRGRYEIQVTPGDMLAFAVGYEGVTEEAILNTPQGSVLRDWFCVEVEDLAAQKPIDCLFAVGGASQTISFHTQCEFFLDKDTARFVRVSNGTGQVDFTPDMRSAAKEVATLAARELPTYATAFLGLAASLDSPDVWSLHSRNEQRYDLAYVVQISEGQKASVS